MLLTKTITYLNLYQFPSYFPSLYKPSSSSITSQSTHVYKNQTSSLSITNHRQMTYFHFPSFHPRRWFRAIKYRTLALPWSLGIFRSYLVRIRTRHQLNYLSSMSTPFQQASYSLPSSPLHYFSHQKQQYEQTHSTPQQYVKTSFQFLPIFPVFLFSAFFLGVLFPIVALLFSNMTTSTTSSMTGIMSSVTISHPSPSPVSISISSSYTSMHKHLHDHYLIPHRILTHLNHSQQSSLLHLFSRPITSTLGSTSKSFQAHPRIVFSYISHCTLIACLRASATAIAYARTTGRHPVLLFHPNAGRAFLSNDIHYNSPHDALFVVLQTKSHPLSKESQSQQYDNDWAEFSLANIVPSTEATIQSSSSVSLKNSLNISSSNSQINSSSSSTPKAPHTSIDNLPKIGNTAEIATLDSASTLDSHIFLTLSDMTWSRYAPRMIQENELVNRFRANQNDTFHTMILQSASLFGRNRETRDVQTADFILHSSFKIPKILLSGMSPFTRQLLLLKLLRKQRRGVKHPRALFVHAQYGLGNRVRALGSAMAFCRRTNRVLVLIWVPDQHLNCRFTDLFVANDEFVVSDDFKAGEEWPFKKSWQADHTMNETKWYNFMRVNGEKVHSSGELIADDKTKHIYVSTCYVLQSSVTPFIIRATSSYWQVLKSLTPHIDVARLVNRFDNYPLSSMIGIHIRSRSIKTDIGGIKASYYSEESSKTTDYWRNLTSVDTFIDEMRRQTVDQLFYVAADQKEVFERLEKEFPTRVFYTPRRCDNREKECLPFALADILLLARCSSLRGSYWSSFSELSTRIGGSRFLLAGIDFGRPAEVEGS